MVTATIPAPIWGPEPEGSKSLGDLELIEPSLILETEAQRRLVLLFRSCHPSAGTFGVHQSPSKPFIHGHA